MIQSVKRRVVIGVVAYFGGLTGIGVSGHVFHNIPFVVVFGILTLLGILLLHGPMSRMWQKEKDDP